MKIKTIVTLLIILLILNLATLGTILYYQLNPPKRGSHSWYREPFRRNYPHARELRLNPQQQQQLRELQRNLRKEIQPFIKESWKLRKEILDLLQQNPVPWGEIQLRQQRLSEIRNQIEMKTMQNIISAKKFLTPEQQKILFKLLIMPHERWRESHLWQYQNRKPGLLKEKNQK